MARRNPNGYGSVVKLKGNRRKPFMACISQMIDEGVILSPITKKSLESKIKALEEASTAEDVGRIYGDIITMLYSDTMNFEKYRNGIVEEVRGKVKKQSVRSRQKKIAIGYFATAQEANIALAEYNKNPYDLDKRTVTFKQVYDLAYEDAKIDKLSESARKGYASAVKKCSELFNVPLVNVKHAHLQKIVDDYSHQSESSLNNITSVYRLVYSFAIKNELCDRDASEYVKIGEHSEPEEKTPFTREEVQYLWEHIDWKYQTTRKSKLNGETFADILLILAYTGLRIEELLCIKSEDVHIEERYINLMGTKTRAAKRLVPIHKLVSPLIEKRLAMGGKYLMIGQSGQRLTYSQLYSALLKQFCEQHGMEHTFHDARHTFATFTKSSKLEPTLRKFIIGHENDDITDDVYTHPEVLLPELIEEIDKLEI